ncbi:MAG: ABC transporter permease subunit, partial [Clostridiaceae bacterium]|nr:ABC transporter permease subunit [Clostridiaceae bacterium]
MKALTRKHLSNTIIYAILGGLSVVWLLPIVWLVVISFREEPGAWTEYILPRSYTLDNYTRLFTETALFNYPHWFMNTLIVAIFTCAISTVLVLMTSYALSRLRFKARRGIMNVGLVMGMFPGFMSMIAIYYILKAMGLSQTLVALVLVYSGGAGRGYYIAKGFFDTIPRSLDEAAIVDGANQNTIFWKIILPL